MRAWLVCSVVILCCMAGCLGPREFIPIRYYSIDHLPPTRPQVSHSRPVTLGVQPFTAATRYRDRILYRVSDVEVGFYEFDRWVEPPEEMVTRVMTAVLRASRLFRQVTSAGNVQPPAWILSGEVTRFDETRAAAGSRAECWLRLELRHARDERLLWSEALTAEEPLTAETPEALAQAMSQAVQEVAMRLVAKLETTALPTP